MKTQLLSHTIFIILLSFSSTLFAQKTKSEKPSDWDKKRINAWVITMSQDTFQGQILMADESKLDLWMSKDPYAKARKDVQIKSFAPKEIKQILLKRDGRIGRKVAFLGLGAGVIGGISFAMATTDRQGGLGFPVFLAPTNDPIVQGGLGLALGLAVGSVLGTLWGFGYGKNKNIKIEGGREMYLKKLSSLRSKALLLNDWGNEFYWKRREN